MPPGEYVPFNAPPHTSKNILTMWDKFFPTILDVYIHVPYTTGKIHLRSRIYPFNSKSFCRCVRLHNAGLKSGITVLPV